MRVRANYKLTESGNSCATNAILQYIFDSQITDETYINQCAIYGNSYYCGKQYDSFGVPYAAGDHQMFANLYLPGNETNGLEALKINIANVTIASFPYLAKEYIFVGFATSPKMPHGMPVFAHEYLPYSQIEDLSQRFKENQ